MLIWCLQPDVSHPLHLLTWALIHVTSSGNGSCIGTDADWTKFNPWRAPGSAPVYDPCGRAGGVWRLRHHFDPFAHFDPFFDPFLTHFDPFPCGRAGGVWRLRHHFWAQFSRIPQPHPTAHASRDLQTLYFVSMLIGC